MQAGRVAQSVARLAKEPEFDTRSGHILSILLPLIQLSVTGESMSTKYWLTTKRSRNYVIRLTDRADMTIGAYLESKTTTAPRKSKSYYSCDGQISSSPTIFPIRQVFAIKS